MPPPASNSSSPSASGASPSDLPRIHEADELSSSQQQQQQSHSPAALHHQSTQSQGFAGTRAFQRAMASRSQAASSAGAGTTAAGRRPQHARRISLQTRAQAPAPAAAAAASAQPTLAPAHEYDDGTTTDDGASTVASFNTDAAFDPTPRPLRPMNSAASRHAPQSMQGPPAPTPDWRRYSGGGTAGGRYHGKAMSMAQSLSNPPAHTRHASFSIGSPPKADPMPDYVSAQHAALQQQIDFLKMQQQSLAQAQAQQQQQQDQDERQQLARTRNPHRRTQSYAPQAYSTSSTGLGLGRMGGSVSTAAPNACGLPRAPAGGYAGTMGGLPTGAGPFGGTGSEYGMPSYKTSAAPGHGRRHSVTVTPRGVPARPVASSQPPAALPDHGATAASRHAPAAPQSPQHYAPPPVSCNPGFGAATSAPASYQLAQAAMQLQTLTPEYLLAGGGLLNVDALGGMGMNDLADGFTGGYEFNPLAAVPARGGGGGGRGGGGHGRTGSMARSMSQKPKVLDLPQAQAQLASLHHSRNQITTGAHSRMASMASYGHGRSNSLGNAAGGGGGGGRKALFGPYLPQSALPPLLSAGKLVVGVLRVNKRNRGDAYVTTEVLDGDIFISGSKDRNRALEGDVVAVELLDPNEVWNIKKEKEDKKRRKEESGGNRPGHASNPSMQGGFQGSGKPINKSSDDIEVEGAQLALIEDETDYDERPPTLAGHVVAIVERTAGQLFSGTLGLLRPSSAATKEKQQAEQMARGQVDTSNATKGPGQYRPRIVWFRPTDKRVPLIAIPADQAPAEFWEEETGSESTFTNRLFVACIKRWPVTSLHPFGSLVEEVGVIGNVEAQTLALLKDHVCMATEHFSDATLRLWPWPDPVTGQEQWTVPEKELANRRDLRDWPTFTLAPQTAPALATDQAANAVQEVAYSVQSQPDGSTQVSVHVSDVAYFVRPGTAVDRDARKRGAAVQLVQRSVPMLPPGLLEAAELRPGKDRLALTILLTFGALPNKGETDMADVTDVWIGRSVVRTDSAVDPVLLTSVLEEHDEQLPLGVAEGVRDAYHLAERLRVARGAEGGLDALVARSAGLTFALDDNGLPTDASIRQPGSSETIAHELSLATNAAVAARLVAALPDSALLVRQDAPAARKLELLTQKIAKVAPGVKVDLSSAHGLDKALIALQAWASESLPSESERLQRQRQCAALLALAQRALVPPKAFSAGMVDIAKYAHYALSVPLLTHLTAPLTRFADVAVQRQILDTLVETSPGSEPTSPTPTSENGTTSSDSLAIDGKKETVAKEAVAKLAQVCNAKLAAGQLAGESSGHLYLCLLVHDLTMRYGPVVRNATVTAIHEKGLDVLVPELNVEKRVHADLLPVQAALHDADTNTLTLHWRSGVDVLRHLDETSADAHARRLRELASAQQALLETTSLSTADTDALFDDMVDEQEKLVQRTRQAALHALMSGDDARASSQRWKSYQLSEYARRQVRPTPSSEPMVPSDSSRSAESLASSGLGGSSASSTTTVPHESGSTDAGIVPCPGVGIQAKTSASVTHTAPTNWYVDSTTGTVVQTIGELDTLPVILLSDMTKSPPVLKVYAINPSAPGSWSAPMTIST